MNGFLDSGGGADMTDFGFDPSQFDCPFHVDGVVDAPCICDGIPPKFGSHPIVEGGVL